MNPAPDESLCHVVTFEFTAAMPTAALASLSEQLYQLAQDAAGVVAYHCGVDRRAREGNADFAVSAVFCNALAIEQYMTDPRHLAILERIKPFIAARSAVQFALPNR